MLLSCLLNMIMMIMTECIHMFTGYCDVYIDYDDAHDDDCKR